MDPIRMNMLAPMGAQSTNRLTPGEAHANFSKSLKDAIDNVNRSQITSDKKTEALAKGEVDDLHDVMVTAQKASITLQTSVEIQSKVVEAYKEVMRMQV
ncbi:flagellar hook-basal body complex protein FliE [Thalassobacillus hwangdonensis]|uniref:Flagellar hook-basal body complex protein FliE n=1 Tax=Thalassobacillus hwangdonensis TaxID=546108 RepID=A0ABW3KZE6_9BACI